MKNTRKIDDTELIQTDSRGSKTVVVATEKLPIDMMFEVCFIK